jgi:predicted O-linked N-acetylglucosamine transferase (SPINDLY family)
VSRNTGQRPQLPKQFTASIQAKLEQGLVLQQQGRLIEAEFFYEEVLRHAPKNFDALHLLGVLAVQTGRTQRGVELIRKAIKLDRYFAVAHDNLGNGLRQLGRFSEALASHEKAIALKPNYAEAHFNRGNVLKDLNRVEEALASYEKAITLKPNFAKAHFGLAGAFRDQNRRVEAVMHIEQTLELKPDFAEARFALCMAQLPFLYMDEPEITARRAAYLECLKALCDDVNQRRISCDWAKAIGSSQPFLLAYQGYNDRDLQSVYGSLVCQIMAGRYPRADLSPSPRSDEPVHLGIVSGFFRQHTVWKILIRGWLSQIDRRRFRIFGYYTGVNEDAATKYAATLCDRFVRGPLSIDRWRQTILDDALHILIYPEVGMDAVSAQLATQRLAPVQCNSWGHPDTSGFPTLDYYLSSELMEPPEAQDHYTERLVRLPNLSIYYEPLDLQPITLSREDLGLRSAATIYWCGQSLFKYLPQFDQVFPRIAREVGDCQFTFIQFQTSTYVTDLLRKRLEKAFADFGLRAADYCVFLPRREDERWFVGAIGQCDIILDSIGWSGGNSTLESLHHGLPIVAMATPLMRGRHSMAILKMMGVEETITETVDDYVFTAIRLAQDVPWRMAVKNRMLANRHKVYCDATCVAALQDFLSSAARSRE